MRSSAFFLCSLCTLVHGVFEDLKSEIFTVENTGKWKGKSDSHVPTLDLEPIKGGGWHAVMWTSHVKLDDHYIGKHWAEDAEGNLVMSHDFSSNDDDPLNVNKNQTTKFNIPKGTQGPLTTYSWCNLHGTWAHTWSGVELWHFQDDVKVDEHGNEIPEEESDDGLKHVPRHEVPVNVKVSAEDLKEFKTNVYTAEAPGPWKGKSSDHVPSIDLHPVEGGGYIADLETTHAKDPAHFISKHWVEDGAGNVIGVVDFDFNDEGEHNQHKKQVSKFHIPPGTAEPLSTFAFCNKHGAWSHTWSTVTLDHGTHHAPSDEL